MRVVFCTGSLIVALAVLIGAGRLWADGKDEWPAKSTPRTRVALVNLTYVIKNYKKYAQFQEEIKKAIAPFQEHDLKLRERAEKLAKSKDSSIIPAKAEDIEEKIKKIQREVEDNNAKAKKNLGKRTDQKIKIIYLDVTQAAQQYALAHGFDLVLHYNDALTKEDYFSAANISRKLQSGALMPFYSAPGMDITMDLTKILNESLKDED